MADQPTNQSETSYADLFPSEERLKSALQVAMDERRLEIEMYWKRGAYLWALSAAAFVGYFSALKVTDVSATAPFVVACLGTAFSIAWYCVNRGSKYWQENWERHVELLERHVHGPLHGLTLDRTKYRLRDLHAAYPFSVSRVHQLLSLFVILVWVALAVGAGVRLPLTVRWGDPTPGIVVGLTLAFAWACWRFGRSGAGPVTRDVVERELGQFTIVRSNLALHPTAAESKNLGAAAGERDR